MKPTLKNIFISALVVLCTMASSRAFYRSPSVNLILEGHAFFPVQDQFMERSDEITGRGTIAIEYQRSFREREIAQCLFAEDIVNCNDCPSIKVSGSGVPDRGVHDWLADYFYLPTDFQSTLQFSPRYHNINVHFAFHLGLDEFIEGLYFNVHAPFTHTRWNLNFTEKNITAGTASHPDGYFGPDAVTRANLLNNAQEFFTGSTITIANGVNAQHQTGAVTAQALKYCKFYNCGCSDKTDNKLSDIEAELGYAFWTEEDYYAAFGARVSIPTGSAGCADFIFAPRVGDDHWKLGASLSFGAQLYVSDDEATALSIHVDGHIQHLFDRCQKRCVDLCQKSNSRYMLAQKLGSTRIDLGTADESDSSVLSGASNAGVEFQNEFAPVANLTTQTYDVSVKWEADVSVTFGWQWDNFDVYGGYEFYARDCEKLCAKSSCATFEENTWALKGDAHVIGYTETDTQGDNNDYATRLAATQNQATIHGGTNQAVPSTNPNIDNPMLALNSIEAVLRDKNLATTINQTHSSVNPVYIKASDFDLSGPKGRSHKVALSGSYTFTDDDNELDFVFGLGGSAELSSISCGDNCTTTSCVTDCSTSCATDCDTDCRRCNINQWSVYLSGGIAF